MMVLVLVSYRGCHQCCSHDGGGLLHGAKNSRRYVLVHMIQNKQTDAKRSTDRERRRGPERENPTCWTRRSRETSIHRGGGDESEIEDDKQIVREKGKSEIAR